MFSYLGFSVISGAEGQYYPGVFRCSWHMLDEKNVSLKVHLLEFCKAGAV